MSDQKKITNENQYRGNKDLDKKMREENRDSHSESFDKKDSPDQEYLRSITDEADENSNVGVEARRNRTDLSENPSGK